MQPQQLSTVTALSRDVTGPETRARRITRETDMDRGKRTDSNTKTIVLAELGRKPIDREGIPSGTRWEVTVAMPSRTPICRYAGPTSRIYIPPPHRKTPRLETKPYAADNRSNLEQKTPGSAEA